MTDRKIPFMRRIQSIMFKLPLMITCSEFEEFIYAYLDGSLHPSKRYKFDLHLKICRECRDYLERYEASLKLVKNINSGAKTKELENVPEDLINAILEARKP